jgi:hypothetical protein
MSSLSLCPGELADTLDLGPGDVDPQRTARSGRARGLPRRLPGAAADVEDVVVDLDAAGPVRRAAMREVWKIFGRGVVSRRVRSWRR